jgi:hypothetical protein
MMRAALAPLPLAYDFDTAHPGIPTPMFANDVLGDCVIAGRAHQTLRFEKIEQGSVLMIKDSDVTKQYFKETGGPDEGLVVSESLERWRREGWTVAAKKYKIRGYSTIDYRNPEEVRAAIYSDVGIGIGVLLPLSAKDQIHTGQPWEITAGPGAARNSWGGHYVYVCGYTTRGPVCVTWGRKQQATWAWIARYCDEAYAIFDAKNQFRTSVLEAGKVDAAMARAFA